MDGLSAQHRHRESANPRHRGFCDCGERMARLRDLSVEREIVEKACRGFVDPIRLLTHAQGRAAGEHGYGDAGSVRTGMDWLREGRAEGADWVNYLTWYAQENPDDPDLHCVFEAIRHVAIAYELLTP